MWERRRLAGAKRWTRAFKSALHRASAKIEYLRVLEKYYTVQHREEILNPSSLDLLLQGAQQIADGGKLLGLAPQVMLEKLDPLRRDWELGGVDRKGRYVQEWQAAVSEWGI